MSITYVELLHGHLISDVPLTAQQHMEVLLIAVNTLRAAWNKPMIVTSGFRTVEDQKRINPSAMHSKHMSGDAVDLADPDGFLYAWAFSNQPKLTEWGLWCELDTKGWLHAQSVPYGSYKAGDSRFFKA